MFAFSIRQIEVFLAVCEAGSFRRGADSLGVSEASVSSHIRGLEDQLGCQLFERRRGTAIRLGETGIAFQQDALAFVRAGIELGRRAKPAQPVTTLRFHIGDHILDDCIRPALPAFLQANPDIALHFVRLQTREEAARAVRTNEVDGALVAVIRPEDLPLSEQVGEAPSGIWARPEMAEIAARNGLDALAYLVSASNFSGFGSYVRALRHWGVDKVRIAARYPYHDVGVRMAIQGAGAIMTLDSIIAAFDPDRRLVRLRETTRWQRRLYLSPHIDPDQARRTRAFLLAALRQAPAAAVITATPTIVNRVSTHIDP